jgi:ribosomal protein L29
MPRLSKPPSWGQVKQRLARMSVAELLSLIRDLQKLSADNRRFLETRLLSPNGEIERYRRQVAEAIYPDTFSRRPISIAAARRAIRQYEAATDDPISALDLSLTFVEQGTAQAVDLGYGDDRYFASLASMLRSALQIFSRLPDNARGQFRSRLVRLHNCGRPLGWGYGDFLSDALSDIVDDDTWLYLR